MIKNVVYWNKCIAQYAQEVKHIKKLNHFSLTVKNVQSKPFLIPSFHYKQFA